MRKIHFGSLVLGLALLAGSQNASAYPFQMAANATIGPLGAQATACNYSFAVPLQCAVQVRGFYPNGVFMDAWANMILMPGQCNFAFVNSGLYPFINAQGMANCWF